MNPMLDRLPDRYTVEQARKGRRATVYLARDLKQERKVAIKVLRPAARG